MSHTTTLTRDGIGRTTAVQNARGDTEHYAFDSDGNLTSVQNGRGKYRYYFYTARSELKQIQFADSTLETYKFDGNGNQTQRINGLSQTINYGYDTTDNLTSVTYPTGTPTTFTYDYDGRQSTMVDSTGTSSWTYDNADNVTQLVTPQGTMQYAYDAWNRRSSLTEGTAVTNYGYTNEKLTSITKSADSVSTTFSYDSYGRLVTKNDGATSTTYGYDGNDRVNSIAHANSSGTFHQETYNYDYVNNLTSKVVNSVATSYTYDAIDQLLTESRSGGYSYGYAYDGNGNRTSKTYGLNVDTYVYDDADKLTSMTKPSGTAYYNYDNCGRLTSVSGLYTRSFTWDYEDRMTSGTVYGTTATNYTYNGVGTRTAKSGPFGSRTYKRDGVGVTAPVLSDGIATMVPGISEKTTSGTSTVHTDRLGSMKAMSSSGSVTDTAEYDAFGNVLSRTGSSLTQKGFAASYGYQEDGESGLKLLGHRYYDPETGRFISRDPAQDGRNWFAYCSNNPLTAVDPSGLWSFYRWLLTDDGDASDDVYDAALNQADHSLCNWWGHFVDRNKRFWPAAIAAVIGVELPGMPIEKPEKWKMDGARANTSLARRLEIEMRRKGGKAAKEVGKKIMRPLAKVIKQEIIEHGAAKASIRAGIVGFLYAEAALAWAATYDTMQDPLYEEPEAPRPSSAHTAVLQ